jgi:hypothetical protein
LDACVCEEYSNIFVDITVFFISCVMKKNSLHELFSLLDGDQNDPMENYFIVLKDNKKVSVNSVSSNILYNTLDFDEYVYALEDDADKDV